MTESLVVSERSDGGEKGVSKEEQNNLLVY